MRRAKGVIGNEIFYHFYFQLADQAAVTFSQ